MNKCNDCEVKLPKILVFLINISWKWQYIFNIFIYLICKYIACICAIFLRNFILSRCSSQVYIQDPPPKKKKFLNLYNCPHGAAVNNWWTALGYGFASGLIRILSTCMAEELTDIYETLQGVSFEIWPDARPLGTFPCHLTCCRPCFCVNLKELLKRLVSFFDVDWRKILGHNYFSTCPWQIRVHQGGLIKERWKLSPTEPTINQPSRGDLMTKI